MNANVTTSRRDAVTRAAAVGPRRASTSRRRLGVVAESPKPFVNCRGLSEDVENLIEGTVLSGDAEVDSAAASGAALTYVRSLALGFVDRLSDRADRFAGIRAAAGGQLA
jgi:hypothetical protein